MKLNVSGRKGQWKDTKVQADSGVNKGMCVLRGNLEVNDRIIGQVAKKNTHIQYAASFV